MAQQAALPPSPSTAGPFLDTEDMPESTLHDQAISLLCAILSWWASRQGIDALVARNLACRWLKEDARIGVDPDILLTIPRPPLPEGRRSLKQLRLWEEGHQPPRVTVEVVSETTADKDYEEAPWAHGQAQTRELWVFDPELHGPLKGGGPFLLQVWQRQANGTMKRVHAGNGPAWSEEMQAWLVLTEGATRLRLSEDRFGKHLWPTEAEARAREAEARAREAEARARSAEKAEAKANEAEARAREAEEARAREAEEARAREAAEIRAREAAEAEVRELRRRLAELEAPRKPQGEG